MLELNFQEVKVWSSDIIRVYSDPNGRCREDSPNMVLLGQITGFDRSWPSIRAQKCFFVEFVTDGNQERLYGGPIAGSGDGFVATVQETTRQTVRCNGLSWGGDCSFTDHCLGTSFLDVTNGAEQKVASSRALASGLSGATEQYPNELDCVFEIQATTRDFVAFEVEYDLETSFDFLELYTGSLSSGDSATLHMALTGSLSTRFAGSGDGQKRHRCIADIQCVEIGFIYHYSVAISTL